MVVSGHLNGRNGSKVWKIELTLQEVRLTQGVSMLGHHVGLKLVFAPKGLGTALHPAYVTLGTAPRGLGLRALGLGRLGLRRVLVAHVAREAALVHHAFATSVANVRVLGRVVALIHLGLCVAIWRWSVGVMGQEVAMESLD